MLELRSLSAGYGRARILFDVGFAVAAGEAVALLGRNGAGKSTTLKAAMGLLRPSAGEVRFQDRRIDGLAPYRIARLGLGYVPEDRRMFGELSVEENLEAGRQPQRAGAPHWTLERVVQLFPPLAKLRSRRAGSLSGGEQQMLAVARTLMGNPRAILLDEPFEGLAPLLAASVADAVRELRREGLSVLISEQNLQFAARVADRVLVLEQGRVVHDGPMAALAADASLRERYLAI
jgi:branched-chain amino acid transport system ATP-binding protein